MIQCATIFTDHMLLQRGKPIAVSARERRRDGDPVSVPERRCTVSGAVGTNGSWCVTLPPSARRNEHTMTVNEQTFTRMWYSVVWLAGDSPTWVHAERCQETALQNWRSARTQCRYFPCREIQLVETLTGLPWMPPTELPSPGTSGTWSYRLASGSKGWRRLQAFPWGSSAAISAAALPVSCWLPEEDLQAHTAGHPCCRTMRMPSPERPTRDDRRLMNM